MVTGLERMDMGRRTKATLCNQSALIEPLGGCVWGQYCLNDTEYGIWNTDCGQAFTFIDGTPTGNEMNFCCFCGKPLIEKPYKCEGDY